MKKNVLYIGNYLNSKKRNASYMFTLGHLLAHEGYSMHYASGFMWKPLRLVHMLLKVFLMRNKAHHVLIDTYSTQNFYYAYLTAKLCQLLKLPYIPILHGGYLPKRLQTSPKLAKSLFNNAVINVSPSLYLKEAFEAQGVTNVVHIPNTLEIQKYPYKQRQLETLKLFWLRSFSEIYNPILALKVLKALTDKGFNAELLMVGPDTDGSLEKAKAYSQSNALKVRFTGKLSKAEWIGLSEQCNLFINTANVDNTPVSVIEAMALGLPVVSTNVGGLPYLIDNEKEGLLVNPDDVEAMVKAIIEVQQNQDLVKTLTGNARQKVEQLDWEVVKHLWFEVLK